jgi:murein DD-endopeptidase MepM/ murein hydrolase activator NlpD
LKRKLTVERKKPLPINPEINSTGKKIDRNNPLSKWIPSVLWGFAALMVAALVFVMVQFFSPKEDTVLAGAESAAFIESGDATANLPAYELEGASDSLLRYANPRTIIPTRARKDVIMYTVQAGDSVFGISQQYNITPETILWANKDTLNDDPHMISIGLELRIPPVDGVYYEWKEGDTLDSVADFLKVEPEAILDWTPNKIDRTDPVIEPDSFVMVPGGQREFQQWVVPTFARGAAGVNSTIAGACSTGEGGAYGTGTFIWPTGSTFISGNDFWSGHLAIDIGAVTGQTVYASDSGVVTYAGGISGGYGNMVMIDHGNGYATLYAHLSAISVACGQSVYQGGAIGAAGSTGNSTGPHLHFEVRYMGGFINPHYVLP